MSLVKRRAGLLVVLGLVSGAFSGWYVDNGVYNGYIAWVVKDNVIFILGVKSELFFER